MNSGHSYKRFIKQYPYDRSTNKLITKSANLLDSVIGAYHSQTSFKKETNFEHLLPSLPFAESILFRSQNKIHNFNLKTKIILPIFMSHISIIIYTFKFVALHKRVS